MAVQIYSIDDLKRIITPIAEKYQVANVYLFGSFARGDYDDQRQRFNRFFYPHAQ